MIDTNIEIVDYPQEPEKIKTKIIMRKLSYDSPKLNLLIFTQPIVKKEMIVQTQERKSKKGSSLF